MKGFKGIIGGLVIGVCTIVLAESVKNTPTSSFIMVIGSIMSIFSDIRAGRNFWNYEL